jgi:hypothetical protein
MFDVDKTSCGELVAKLSTAMPHYVRTIKPNAEKEVLTSSLFHIHSFSLSLSLSLSLTHSLSHSLTLTLVSFIGFYFEADISVC